ncbi:MAG: hypothetical protein AB1428_10685 [Bacteroidota bacterium]
MSGVKRKQIRGTVIAAAAAVLLSAGCADHEQRSGTPMDDALRSDIEAAANKRIFFGHQSVGVDIMQGVRDLAAAAGARMRVVPLDSLTGPEEPYFADALVGKNSEPDTKCDAFRSVVERLAADSLDIALLKFCYVDIKQHTDVQRMFRYYTETMEDLKRRFPGVTFVHVTVPLTERTAWWRRTAKALLGRDDEWDAASIKRTEFNAMLRQRYAHEPLFDLAAIEAMSPDGTVSKFESGGKEAYTLVPAYTRDGGHLNEFGRKHVARELLRLLAEISRRGTR